MEIEIMFSDLSDDKQMELLDAAGISDPSDANWDVFPVTTVFVESPEEEKE